MSSCEGIGNNSSEVYSIILHMQLMRHATHKKYGNLMKHIKRPIFPRHTQSALTLIVVQEKLKIRDYISQFLGVLNQIWKSESYDEPHSSVCSQQ